jgi:Domain of unknown function (DUF5925)/ATPase family associated with various cellular activities (AAA)
MSETGKKFDLGVQHELQGVEAMPFGRFLDLTAARGLGELRLDSWPTGATEIPDLGDRLLAIKTRSHEACLFADDGALVHVSLAGAHVHAIAAATEKPPIERIFEQLHELFPPPDPSSAHEVPVTFWTYGPHGPQPSWRSIGVPGWDEIADNYTARTSEQLGAIMRGFKPAHGGQLILWHGQAGTGKTFALRALAWEWRDWCQLHYIVDPDSFFGAHADYLMSVLMQPAFPMMVSRGGMIAAYTMGMGVEDDEEKEEKAWRVLVLEDTGELLSADARASMGQGLSRFLNVVDGLIGQGLRILVLVTTNEEVRKLNPAVARPGRCAANIEFKPLTGVEATAWLERHEHPSEVDGFRTLASLYAELEGRDPADVSLVGFAP